MSYASIGSGSGIQLIKGERSSTPPISYAGSDIPLSEQEQKQFPDLKALPVMAGAVVIAFNIKGIEYLNFSMESLTGIYNGSIQFWNHSILQEMNPGYRLPDSKITVIARSDKSGTTYSFTSALSASSATWHEQYGVFSEGLDENRMPVKWNSSAISFYGYSNRGMSGLILSLPYSIGYTTVADSFYAKLKFAKIRNNAGSFVEASTETVQNSILDSGGGFGLLNPTGKFSYPIAAFTFFIVKVSKMTDCDSAIELVRYVDWFYTSTSAQTECEKLFMVPMEPHVAENITSLLLQTLTCNGKNVWSMFEEQKLRESEPADSGNTVVYIISSCLCILVCVSVFVFSRQKWTTYKHILSDPWFIKFSDIHFDREDIEKVRLYTNSPALDTTLGITQSPQIRYAWETTSIKLGVIDSELVFLLKSASELKTNTFKAKKTLIWFKDAIDHNNVAKLVGLTRSTIRWFSVYKGELRGSIVNIIRSPTVKISTAGIVVLCKEIIQGMEYIHKKGIVHGNLRGSCCLVDMSWKIKIADWHEAKFRSCTKSEDKSMYDFKNKTNEDDIRTMFWFAPELIKFQRSPTQEGDVYSFGIVMQELFSKQEPYHEISLPPKEILTAILSCCIRPKFSENTPPLIRNLMDRAWEMDPAARPSFTVLRQIMKGSYPNDNSLTDCIMKSVEEYATCLERELSEAKKEMVKAQEASKAVLLDNAPSLVVERFLNNETIAPTIHKFGTLLACSFTNISHFVTLFDVKDVLGTLDALLTGIDQIALSKNVTKLSVNGENVLFAADPKSPALIQVQTVSTFAIMVMNHLERISQKAPAHYLLQMRMGVATGSVLVAVIGKRIPKYIVIGEAVTSAFKMLSESRQRTIRLSRGAYDMVKQRGPMFETCLLKGGLKEDDENSYWLISQHGLEGRFPPPINY